MKFKLFAASVMLVACAIPASAQVKLQADNVDAVLKAMTLEEKATLCIGYSRAHRSACRFGTRCSWYDPSE